MTSTTAPAALAWSTEGCPIGGAMEVLGDRWTLVVMREVINGIRRFDDIRRHTGIPRQVLTNRLTRLVEDGLLHKVPYQPAGERARHEYRLTEKGFDLYPILLAIKAWGDTYVGDAATSPVAFHHRECGAEVRVEMVCDDGHRVTRPREVIPAPGPGAVRL